MTKKPRQRLSNPSTIASDKARWIGQQFGSLTITDLNKVAKGGTFHNLASCDCDCGKQITVAFNSLKAGQTTDCGCKKPLKVPANKPSLSPQLSAGALSTFVGAFNLLNKYGGAVDGEGLEVELNEELTAADAKTLILMGATIKGKTVSFP